MADHTVTLSADQEIALEATVEAWLILLPATAWTGDLVVTEIVNAALLVTSATIEVGLTDLRTAALALPAAVRAAMIATLSGAQQAMVPHLLP